MPHDRAKTTLPETTAIGTYFVSNYPLYDCWSPDQVDRARAALEREPAGDAPLGIYVHIPFCRKRCRFCYFKVYTDQDSERVNRYLDGLIRELRLYSEKPFIGGRKARFIYFGGGTPSFISTQQLGRLVDEMKALFPWDEAEEVTFECEPGTLTERKLEMLRDIGVTRLSLGVENFSDEVLEINGRAHGSKEIDRAYETARRIGFLQINIDLIAGMVGESDENWRSCVSQALAMAPDSLTAYQMEVPPNTTLSKQMRETGAEAAPVADWPVKRHWVAEAFEAFEAAGYTVTSGYTVVKDPARTSFRYRDLLWRGADMMALGVASFAHVNGVHFQNESSMEPYLDKLERGELPLRRAWATTPEERAVREFILQMKLGRVDRRYFERKFGFDVSRRFSGAFERLRDSGWLELDEHYLSLTRDGLLRVDWLLREFFLPLAEADAAA